VIVDDVIPVVIGVTGPRDNKLAQIAYTLGGLSGSFGLGKRREEQAGQNRDDCDDHKKFNEGKSTPANLKVMPCRSPLISYSFFPEMMRFDHFESAERADKPNNSQNNWKLAIVVFEFLKSFVNVPRRGKKNHGKDFLRYLHTDDSGGVPPGRAAIEQFAISAGHAFGRAAICAGAMGRGDRLDGYRQNTFCAQCQ
jgi:hypothetical protein